MVILVKSECIECGDLLECLEKGRNCHITENDKMLTQDTASVNLLKGENKGKFEDLIKGILRGK